MEDGRYFPVVIINRYTVKWNSKGEMLTVCKLEVYPNLIEWKLLVLSTKREIWE